MRRVRALAIPAAVLAGLAPAAAQAQTTESTAPGPNWTAVAVFLAFVASTLAITWWAARRTHNRDSFYTAAGGIPPFQNGLAIAGDFMSAATFLGITGLIFFTGYDAYILSFGILVGWPIMLMVIAERFRNLGRYTLVNVVAYRLQRRSVKLLAAVTSFAVILFYLIGQMVGAGKLVELLFGLDYAVAVVTVSVLMILYVSLGGMIATTWVQMIKAALLLLGGVYLGVMVLARFGFDFAALLRAGIAVHPKGMGLVQPGGWLGNDPVNVLTVGLTMCFGIMGLPHILMRFFTVKDAAAARTSVSVATLLMAAFYILILVIGFGAVALIWGRPGFYDDAGGLVGGGNMVALHLASALGGDIALGFLSAVAFATILAVVAGLTLAGAAAIAHDIYADVIHNGEVSARKELRVSRAATLVIGLAALLLGLAFEHQNIAVVTALALALSASVNFPLLLLAMYWKGLTSRGAVAGGSVVLLVSGVLIVLSDSVWVQMLGHERALFPYLYPTVVTMPLAFLLIWGISLMDRSPRAAAERTGFAQQFLRAETGRGAYKAQAE